VPVNELLIFSLGNNGNIDGFGFSLGTGYNASSATTMNGNCSIRN
jgi:hypothetical protein